jgi:RNA polymerase sigma-70 factor (ECF subfamily)
MKNRLQEVSKEFLANRDALASFITALAHDPHLAEDVFQEVWIRLTDSVERGVEIQDVVRWSRGVARNILLEHWRKKRTAKVIMDSNLADLVEKAFDEDTVAEEIWAARGRALEECLGKMPSHSRDILRLKYHDGQSVAEIAGQIQKSVNNAMVILSRLRKALGDCVEEKMHAEGAPS